MASKVPVEVEKLFWRNFLLIPKNKEVTRSEYTTISSVHLKFNNHYKNCKQGFSWHYKYEWR